MNGEEWTYKQKNEASTVTGSTILGRSVGTVGIKIIRALEKIHVQNSYLMLFYEMRIRHIMIFRLYTVYNKHDMIKIGN